jgi:hypothetical protein
LEIFGLISRHEFRRSQRERCGNERRRALEVAALIAHLNRADNPEFQTELDWRMAAMDAGRKTSAPALKKVTMI